MECERWFKVKQLKTQLYGLKSHCTVIGWLVGFVKVLPRMLLD